MAISTETLLVGGVVVSVLALVVAIMLTIGDQYSRFGSAMRCLLAAVIFVLVIVYDVPSWLDRAYGIGVAAVGAIWVASVVGAFVMVFGAIVQFATWLRQGEGELALREPDRDAKRGAQGEQG
jgi:hypothetical protein